MNPLRGRSLRGHPRPRFPGRFHQFSAVPFPRPIPHPPEPIPPASLRPEGRSSHAPPPSLHTTQSRTCSSLGPAPERGGPPSTLGSRPSPLRPTAWPRPFGCFKGPATNKMQPWRRLKAYSLRTSGESLVVTPAMKPRCSHVLAVTLVFPLTCSRRDLLERTVPARLEVSRMPLRLRLRAGSRPGPQAIQSQGGAAAQEA